jgi:hypothetical protein
MSNLSRPRDRSRWQAKAACAGRLDLDFIEPSPEEAQQCRVLCASCEVRESCLFEALASGEVWGIWGGLDAKERAWVAAQEGLPDPAMIPAHGTNPRYAKHRCRCGLCRAAHAAYERARRADQRAGTARRYSIR